MQPAPGSKVSTRRGSALLAVLGLSAATLVLLAGTLQWTSNNALMIDRSTRYHDALLAAEAATEKALTDLSADFARLGASAVAAKLAAYRTRVPDMNEHPRWSQYRFMDGEGQEGAMQIEQVSPWGLSALISQYRGLSGYAATYRILARAQDLHARQPLIAGVQQDVQIALVPVFQFAIFYNLDLEVNPGARMDISGRVHCNYNIYTQPAAPLTFLGDVTAAGEMIMNKKPGDPVNRTVSTTTFLGEHDAGVMTLHLPIGTNNTPQAVRQIVEIPPAGESPNSDLGRQRFYNLADIVILVKDAEVEVWGGGMASGSATKLQWSSVSNWIRTGVSFYDKRETKTVQATQLDLAKFYTWNAQSTNALKNALKRDINSIYIADQRTLGSGQMPGVRLINGDVLPPLGLTVATPDPLYVKGHFNASGSSLGTHNTGNTKPAALIADAIAAALANGAPPQADISLADLAWAVQQAQAQRAIRGKLLRLPRTDPPELMQVLSPYEIQVPIAPLARQARGFGHVVFLHDPGGTVRRLPMLIRWNDKVIPQLALRLATDILELNWDQAQVTPDKITVPALSDRGRPVLTMYLDQTGQTLVNWTRPGQDWSSCFAPVPAGAVFEVAELRRLVEQNNQWLQTRLLAMVQLIQPTELERYKTLKMQEQRLLGQEAAARAPVPAAASQPVEKRLQDQLQQIRTQEVEIETACIDMLNQWAPDLPAAIEQETDPAEKARLQLAAALHKEIAQGQLAELVRQKNSRLTARIEDSLKQLRDRLAGRTVFVGCTAAGLGDIVSTPAWDKVPGVMTHAQMLNGLLADRAIRPIGAVADSAIVLLCCLAATLATSGLGPRSSLSTVAAGCAAFVGLSAFVLFERMGLVVALATPILGVFVTWAMITAYRQLVEQRAKRHITRTLQQYTSPALARTSPQTVLISVDLPAPLEPSSATISPASIASETPRSTSTWP